MERRARGLRPQQRLSLLQKIRRTRRTRAMSQCDVYDQAAVVGTSRGPTGQTPRQQRKRGLTDQGNTKDMGDQLAQSFQKLTPAQQEQTRKAMYESVTKKPFRERP
jgi:hypothetical protein